MLYRPVDQKICLICNQPILLTEDGLMVTVPLKQLKKRTKTSLDKMKIKWDCSKTSNCWLTLNSGAVKLSSSEVNLIKNVQETIERYDTIEIIRKSIVPVAKMLLDRKRTVVFTGAGISVSSGIPTYRGAEGIDTVASIQGTKISSSNSKVQEERVESDEVPMNKNKRVKKEIESKQNEINSQNEEEDEEKDIDYLSLQPTLCHRAITKLQQNDLIQYVITQNCDDLHAKSGLPREYISELHGNVFVESCENCWTEYYQDYCVDVYSTDCYLEPYYKKCPTCHHNHYTGRFCSRGKCKGKLRDTIVNFGDDLHLTILGGLPKAKRICRTAELFLSLGTSLSVYPAAALTELAKVHVIVNPQVTELENDQNLFRFWTSADIFMAILLETLEINC